MKEKSERILMVTVFAVFAYEWLISGFDKLLSGKFVTSLHSEMMQAMPDIRYQFYAHLLTKYGLAHCVVLGAFVETGELFAGLSFAVLAVQAWRGRLQSKWILLGVSAGIVGALMNLNFLFYQGGSLVLNSNNPFDEGIPLDMFMFLIQIGIVGVLWKMRKTEVQADCA
jgi:thiosulfate dehydrogenase [quinone] large subunit